MYPPDGGDLKTVGQPLFDHRFGSRPVRVLTRSGVSQSRGQRQAGRPGGSAKLPRQVNRK
ncbi:hypothetical protein BBAL3_2932 [Brevundimonas sp. BAL3]|nr:hypothetical protein BBAL3_2932 [Brevundimonas sp. BAL3]